MPGEISKILPLEFWHFVEVFVHAFDHFDSLLPRSYQSKAQVHIRTDFSFHAKPLVISSFEIQGHLRSNDLTQGRSRSTYLPFLFSA